MGIISNDSIKIKGIDEEVELRDLNIEIKPNEHGYARISLRVKNDAKPENIIKNVKDKLVTIESTEKGNSGVLFKGYIAKCNINSRQSSGVVGIELISTSIKLDMEKRSESYQVEKDTYKSIINKAITKDGGENSYFDKTFSSKTIGKPIIRYEETSWEFAKRIISRHRLPVIIDETADKPTFMAGYKSGGTVEESKIDKSSVTGFMRIGEYTQRKQNEKNSSVKVADYEGISFRSFYNYKIGDSVTYNGESYNICTKKVKTERAQLVFIYEAGSDKLYGPEPVSNEMLRGRCLLGKVVKTEDEKIKLQLEIDKEEKSEKELYWFKWMPETGNMMYVMPEKNTVVSLYVGGEDEGDAIVINAIRKDKKEKKYEKNENKYLTTEKGMRMLVAKEEVGVTGNGNTKDVSDEHGRNTGKAYLNIHDKDGIVVATEKKIYMEAKDCIEIKAGNKLTISGNKILQIKKGRNALKLKNKIAVIGTKASYGKGAVLPETIDEEEPVTIKNTGKTVNGEELTDEQKKIINEMFRGDQFKKEDSFSATVEPRLRAELAQVNKSCTCVFEENVKKSVVKNNDGYYKRLNKEEQKLKEKLAETRQSVPQVTEDTIMQKVIGQDVFENYIKSREEMTEKEIENSKKVKGCVSRAQDVAPYVGNGKEAHRKLRLVLFSTLNDAPFLTLNSVITA